MSDERSAAGSEFARVLHDCDLLARALDGWDMADHPRPSLSGWFGANMPNAEAGVAARFLAAWAGVERPLPNINDERRREIRDAIGLIADAAETEVFSGVPDSVEHAMMTGRYPRHGHVQKALTAIAELRRASIELQASREVELRHMSHDSVALLARDAARGYPGLEHDGGRDLRALHTLEETAEGRQPGVKLRAVYRSLRRRALAFNDVFPEVTQDLPLREDTQSGIDEIAAWAAAAAETVRKSRPDSSRMSPAVTSEETHGSTSDADYSTSGAFTTPADTLRKAARAQHIRHRQPGGRGTRLEYHRDDVVERWGAKALRSETVGTRKRRNDDVADRAEKAESSGKRRNVS